MKALQILLLLFAAGFSSYKTKGSSLLAGRVVNENGVGIPNAAVLILNTPFAVISDADGRFSINEIKAGSYYLKTLALGYAASVTAVYVNDTAGDLNIVLYPGYKRIGEVTVTARKMEEDLAGVPGSVTVVSAKGIEESRIWDIKDLTGIAPNLYIADPGDKRNVSSIRGITTTSYEQAVATYIDGVSQFGLDTYIPQLFDVERVEILRGPQGTLYGRNAMGGVINVITKKPGNKPEGFAEANAGNFGLRRFTAGVKTPILKDRLFFGVAGLYERFDGYYTNQFDYSRYDKQKTAGGNYYLQYRPSRSWVATLNLKHMDNRNNGPFPLVVGADAAFAEPYKLNQDARTTMVDKLLNASMAIDHSGSRFNFSSLTSYQFNRRYYTDPIDADFSPMDGISIINDFGGDWNAYKVLNQEFRLSSPARVGKLAWTVGTYFFKQTNPVKQATRFGGDALMLGVPDTGFSVINTMISEGSGAAIFGQASLKLNKLTITAGLRYDYEHKAATISGSYQEGSNPDSAFITRSDTSASTSFSAFSPKLSFAYSFSERNMTYVSYSRGFRAGGLSPITSDPAAPPLYEYKPEYSDNLELGMKHSFFENRVRFYVAGFYSRLRDVQLPTLVLPEAVTVTKNTGELTSKGVEMELTSKVLKGLEGSYSFGYTDARYQSLKASVNGEEKDFNGNRQVFTPRITSMLALQYRIRLDRKEKCFLFLRGEWQHSGQQYFDLANSISQSPYNLFNTRAGVELGEITIAIWGRNLGDYKYISYAYDFGAVHLGAPRTFGATAGIRLR